ncbi:MAG TPA: molybdopterin cofactor-binding domain-containing protein, partial [Terriglobales bacterium]|nr:molybdopterin cofactor-binding domain-containing protein [Terriglobales bacterium]
GMVTAYTGKCDFGQGMLTVQTQLVAEELCVSMGRVKLIQCDTSITPDQGTTSGSQSTPTNFNSDNLAQAAATAREELLKMAAAQWSEPAAQLLVSDGVITSKTGRRITYQELIGSKRFNLPVSTAAKRRSPDQWTVLGKPVPSVDRVALMTGQFEFVHNVCVPGMLHGRVVRPPEVGTTVASVDEASVRQISGLVKVVVRKNFIGVVAEKQWQAVQAASHLKVKWNPGPGLPPQKTFYDGLRKQPSRDTLIIESKDVEQQFTSAPDVVRATYAYPYQMHGSVGTSCAVADVKDGHATLWSATQSVYPTRSIVAKLLELPLDSVRVIYVRGSGCYGLNGADTVSFDAALLSHAVGRPVRIQLSRQDEMAWENFGAACVVDQRAGIDHNGAIVVWECENWVASLGSRPGYDKPGNVITGLLVGYEPERVKQRPAAPPSGKLENGSNAVPSYFAGCINGSCAGAGTIRNERVLSHTVASPFFTGPLRSPLRIQNTFAHECFMDEICARSKADPLAFRLQHLRETRLINCLKSAAEAAKWEERPSPKPKGPRTGIATGRGIACVAYEGDNGYAALIAEVSVDLANGRIQPQRFTVAIDAGPISNPDGLRNQTEGGILQGMSRALVEEVKWDDTRVTSTDWETYNSLYLDFEMPAIDVVLLNPKGVPATGAGETAITVVAAAIGNAVFDATGIRLREVPFTPERFKEAMLANEKAVRS